MELFLAALGLQAGHNAALVAIGAALLGIAAGTAGTFLYLRKRVLVSDALAHATLPGIGLAFMAMVALGGDGRSLAGLLAGAAVTAGLGLLAVDAIVRRTRLPEDAAIGAVLSVSFGFGIVLLTVIQTLSAGRQAGLEGFLLGATAGMLRADAVMIALGGAVVLAALLVLRRPLLAIAFDPGFAQSAGLPVRMIDLALLGLVMAVVVIGLKVVGLVLIVALLIIPAVTARLWTDRAERVALGAALVGGLAGFLGAAVSASAPGLPTGPVIVLLAAAAFAASLALAPRRGALAALARRWRFQIRVHRRQGLLALAHGETVLDRLTLRILRREGLIRADGVPTDLGTAEAARALRDERRRDLARTLHREDRLAGAFDGLAPVDELLTRDEIAEIDRRLGPAGGAA